MHRTMQSPSRQVWHTALLKRIYDSKICGRKKNVNVLLPEGYTTAKKYPVLYVLCMATGAMRMPCWMQEMPRCVCARSLEMILLPERLRK